MKTKSLFYGFAAALLLAGCGPTTTSSQSASPSESETPTETSTPTSSSPTSSSSSSSEEEDGLNEEGFPKEWESYDLKTASELLTIGNALTGEDPTSESYYMAAYVEAVTNPTYGNMDISDSTGELKIYGLYSEDGSVRYDKMETKPVAGDFILISGPIKNFKGTIEFEDAKLIDLYHPKPNLDPEDYEFSTIAEVREAEDGETIKTKGTVLRFTYNTNLNKIGFVMADNTASIYVYDSQIAPQVEEGEEVTILGTKDYWILDSEADNAEKHGYQGCNQIAECVLVDHKAAAAFDYDSIAKETTVKEVLETPFTTDITSVLYKSQAYISKSEGGNFVNYYINDLDEKTGQYVYTQASGRDFEWMDEYVDKFVNIYYVALNAKMTESGGNWRLLPIAVSDEPFVFDKGYATEFAIEYYAAPQFGTLYAGDPNLEVITSVSSEKLNFGTVNIAYSSSDEDVAYFTTEAGVTTFHVNYQANSEATITIKATLDGQKEYTRDLEIKAIDYATVETDSVADAIASQDGDKLTIRAKVGPSLVNKKGFYLIDESGVIATELAGGDEAFDGTFDIGDTVVIEGTRGFNGTNNTQIRLYDASIVANIYGEDMYSTASFITGRTLADMQSAEFTPGMTASVYVLTGVSVTKSSGMYPTYYLNQAGNEKGLQLYSSSASQYAWLDAFVGKEVEVAVAPCDWNSKGMKGCVLSVKDGEQVTYNTLNFPSK